MKIFRWNVSNWWLLAIPPFLFLVGPALLMLFLMGNNLAGAIVGPPALWNRPWHNPSRAELTGDYLESGHPSADLIHHRPVHLSLRSDGSMTVSDLPTADFENPSCLLTGTGTWNTPDSDHGITLTLTTQQTSTSCKPGSYPTLEVAGHSRPYTLYWILGDPDSGTGIWLKPGQP